MESLLLNRLDALAHPQRLRVYRLLLRRWPDEVPAGEIAEALDLKGSTSSVYFSALLRAGLIAQRREGVRLYYRVAMEGARAVMSDLFLDAFQGRAELLPDVRESSAPATGRYRVLFLCTGNSARSIFAEALLRDIAGDRFEAFSAGTAERSELNPVAIEMLRQKGHDISPLRSKNLKVYTGKDAVRFDFVFTVCDLAANEECPAWEGQPISGHWGMPDPVKAQGTEAERRLAFQSVYGNLRNRIAAFAALPIDTLDRASLQHEVDRIGRMNREMAGDAA
ncbi:helix-turn-helix domain-containing protein [Sulfitobacter sp. LCG007]